MRQADLRLAKIIDFDALDRIDLWDHYTASEQIDGLIYMDYEPYDKERGRIVWSNGKPVVSAAAKLWRRLPGSEEDAIVEHLNQAPRTLRSAAGYSIVVVHAWSFSVSDVVAVAERLDPGVDIVPPDVFFERVHEHLKPE